MEERITVVCEELPDDANIDEVGVLRDSKGHELQEKCYVTINGELYLYQKIA